MRIQRYQPLVALAACCLMFGTAHAEPLQFNVQPGGATLQDGTGAVVASSGAGRMGTLRLDLDPTGGDHSFKLVRPPFDEETVTFHPDHGQWHWKTSHQEGQLNASTLVILARTVALRVQPDGSLFYTDAEASNGSGEDAALGQVIDLSGVPHRVVPLEQSDGKVRIPNGYFPRPVIVTHARFAPKEVLIPEGALDTPASEYPTQPVSLSPLYGPFSYPMVSVGAILAAALAGGFWWVQIRPRKLREQGKIAMLDDILTGRQQLLSKAADTTGQGSKKATGSVLTTENSQQYLLLGILGAGAGGTVYQAVRVDESASAREHVAIKVLKEADTAVSRDRFLREAKICQSLQHPSIVKVLDYGVTKALTPFMVMELVSGKSLRQIVTDAAGPLAPDTVIPWLNDVLAGLRAAHQAGIVHRDIKPDNLMLTNSGRVKVMDFGVAHTDGQTQLTAQNASLGTPRYMSPEHRNAPTVGPQSDIYSLGVVAYELLAGRAPYLQTEVWSLFFAMSNDAPPPLRDFNPTVSTELEGIVLKMMAVSLEERYPTAAAVLDALGVAP